MFLHRVPQNFISVSKITGHHFPGWVETRNQGRASINIHSLLLVKNMFFRKQKFDVKQLKLNKFIFNVKQLKISRFIFDVKQLKMNRFIKSTLDSSSNATLEEPSLHPCLLFYRVLDFMWKISFFQQSNSSLVDSSLQTFEKVLSTPSLIFLYHVKVLNISLPLSPITYKNVEYCCSSVFPDITAFRYNCIVYFYFLHVAVAESKFITVGFGSRCSILISLIQSKFDDFFFTPGTMYYIQSGRCE